LRLKCTKTHLRAYKGPKNFLGSLSLAIKGRGREGGKGGGKGGEGRGGEGKGGEGKGKGGYGNLTPPQSKFLATPLLEDKPVESRGDFNLYIFSIDVNETVHTARSVNAHGTPLP
jgi:hypothetical protein